VRRRASFEVAHFSRATDFLVRRSNVKRRASFEVALFSRTTDFPVRRSDVKRRASFEIAHFSRTTDFLVRRSGVRRPQTLPVPSYWANRLRSPPQGQRPGRLPSPAQRAGSRGRRTS
jgi:hypothetical protein